jgi:HSP20 family protein
MRAVQRRWDPWRDFEQLQREMNRLLGQWQPRGTRQAEFPAVNLWRSQDSVLLTAELPGLDAEKLDLTVSGDQVTLRGTHEAEESHDGDSWQRRERPRGAFVRTISLPFEVDSQSAEASYDKGILTVKLQRPEEQKPRKVAVRVG